MIVSLEVAVNLGDYVTDDKLIEIGLHQLNHPCQIDGAFFNKRINGLMIIHVVKPVCIHMLTDE